MNKVKNEENTCTWEEDKDGIWDTSCNNKLALDDGTPFENGMKFCCYCGDRLKQKENKCE